MDLVSAVEPQSQAPPGRSTVLMEISNAMVALYKAHFGRGPTSARTHWSGPDSLTCYLEGTLTLAEQNLVRMGEHQRLRDTRMFFQYATVNEFCEPVERLTGRTIRSFLSAIDTEADGLAMEAFVFYPEGREGPSRTTLHPLHEG